jgi:hypothetical protein
VHSDQSFWQVLYSSVIDVFSLEIANVLWEEEILLSDQKICELDHVENSYATRLREWLHEWKISEQECDLITSAGQLISIN